MALRDLIVHLDQGESAHERLRLAANLAHRHGCRLTAVYVRERNEAQSDLQRTAELARASCKDFDRIRKHVRLCIDNGAARLRSELDALQRELAIEVHWRSVDGIASKVVPQQARFSDGNTEVGGGSARCRGLRSPQALGRCHGRRHARFAVKDESPDPDVILMIPVAGIHQRWKRA